MVSGFGIPVNDMARAKTFYETIFETTVDIQNFGGCYMGWFPFEEHNPGEAGNLIKQDGYVPSQEGTLFYFNCDDYSNENSRVQAAGRKVVQLKTEISPEHGFMGVFIDKEGHRVALHSKR